MSVCKEVGFGGMDDVLPDVVWVQPTVNVGTSTFRTHVTCAGRECIMR